MRSTADFNDGGIAVDNFDLFVRDMEQIGDDLRKTGLVTLAVRLRADHGIDRAIRAHMPEKDIVITIAITVPRQIQLTVLGCHAIRRPHTRLAHPLRLRMLGR